MKIEVLYVADCPSHPAAVELVKHILATQGLDCDVHEVRIRDQKMAQELRFCGSPTIRINGRDVASDSPGARHFSLSCRLYPGSQRIGLPPAELVRKAVEEAHRGT